MNHDVLKAGLEAMNLTLIVDEAHRLPQLNAVSIPEGIDEAVVRQRLLKHYNLEIGAGLGALAGKVWRIGQMGHASNIKNIMMCINALGLILNDLGHAIEIGAVASATQHKLREQGRTE